LAYSDQGQIGLGHFLAANVPDFWQAYSGKSLWESAESAKPPCENGWVLVAIDSRKGVVACKQLPWQLQSFEHDVAGSARLNLLAVGMRVGVKGKQ